MEAMLNEVSEVEVNEAAHSREETTAPITTQEAETTIVYHKLAVEFFDQGLASSDIDALYEHLQAILKTLGIEWQNSQVFNQDVVGSYTRETLNPGYMPSEFKTVLKTGKNLPDYVSGTGCEVELTLLARAIALHLSTTTHSPCSDVQAVWMWEHPVKELCESSCQVQESVSPCNSCRLSAVCSAEVRKTYDDSRFNGKKEG